MHVRTRAISKATEPAPTSPIPQPPIPAEMSTALSRRRSSARRRELDASNCVAKEAVPPTSPVSLTPEKETPPLKRCNSARPSAGIADGSSKRPLVRTNRSDEEKDPKKQCLARLLPASAKPNVIGDADFNLTWTENYFNSYGHFSVHEAMLKDETRTTAYRKAIVDNPHLFKGKTVLDVGCGTGILSCFAAEAGAKKVYAVDCSEIVEQTRIIIDVNGYEDVIEVVQTSVEKLELLEKVDIIISEWMGNFLFAENVLQSVLLARDRWLKPGGLMFPDSCAIFLCAIEDSEDKADRIEFWDDVYGLDMSCVKSLVITEPVVDVVDAKQIITNCDRVMSMDVTTATVKDLSFAVPFRLSAQRSDHIHALVGYFSIKFSHGKKPISLNTSPRHERTHWEQTLLYLDKPLRVKEGEVLQGTLAFRPNRKNRRDLDIAIEYEVNGLYTSVKKVHRYRLR